MAVNLASITGTTAGHLGYWVVNTSAATALIGSALGDSLNGAAGNDTLVGDAGTDVLNGDQGSDLYIVSLTADHSAAEFVDSGTTGVDEVRSTSAVANSSLSLYAGDLGIERVVIGTGTTATAVSTAKPSLSINAVRSPMASPSWATLAPVLSPAELATTFSMAVQAMTI